MQKDTSGRAAAQDAVVPMDYEDQQQNSHHRQHYVAASLDDGHLHPDGNECDNEHNYVVTKFTIVPHVALRLRALDQPAQQPRKRRSIAFSHLPRDGEEGHQSRLEGKRHHSDKDTGSLLDMLVDAATFNMTRAGRLVKQAARYGGITLHEYGVYDPCLNDSCLTQ